jgi:hypothetical protein
MPDIIVNEFMAGLETGAEVHALREKTKEARIGGSYFLRDLGYLYLLHYTDFIKVI